jgi:5-methylcytosine-specific restriction enzyme A
MPTKAKKYCGASRCPERIEVGQRYCLKHLQQRQRNTDKRRGSANQRGYDADWRRLRDWHITNKPLCEICLLGGRVTGADHVDHIEPFHGKNDPLRLDPKNLQSLCKSCHSRKTVKEDGGFGNEPR